MAKKHTIEERIAHFLRLAEDAGATQAERDTAAAQAERLMLKHGIEEIDLDTGLPRAEEIIKVTIDFGGAYAYARMFLAYRVARSLKVKSYRQTVKWSGIRDHASGKVTSAGERFTVVAYESDARAALELIASVDVQAAVSVKQWAKERKAAGYFPPETRDRADYIVSFGGGAAKRIEEMRNRIVAEAEETRPGTALALVDKERAVAAWLRENEKLKSGRGSTLGGNSAGYRAGTRANVGGRGIGAGQRALGA